MNFVDIITRKRDGLELSPSEIEFAIRSYSAGEVPDYQMAAFAMAVYCRGMESHEVVELTRRMLLSGEILLWEGEERPVVDKHSTGGIGDKTSLIIAPLLATCDVIVPMISGRGLGPTGGTLDKLESIEGFKTNFDTETFQAIVRKTGCAIVAASEKLAPADRKLYALRDVTGTVASIPLITSSILSKKLAEGLNALVLDVKAGSGAFMKTSADARLLAASLIGVANKLGVKTSAIVSDMNQPLGRMVGNAVEIMESIEVLRGDSAGELRRLSIELAAILLVQVKRCGSLPEARQLLSDRINSGAGYEKFKQMIAAQGGNLKAKLLVAPGKVIVAKRAGNLHFINGEALGRAVIELGGGRKKVGDPVNHKVGLEMLVSLGDRVEKGRPLVKVFCEGELPSSVTAMLEAAFHFSQEPTLPAATIIEKIGIEG